MFFKYVKDALLFVYFVLGTFVDALIGYFGIKPDSIFNLSSLLVLFSISIFTTSY